MFGYTVTLIEESWKPDQYAYMFVSVFDGLEIFVTFMKKKNPYVLFMYMYETMKQFHWPSASDFCCGPNQNILTIIAARLPISLGRHNM